MPERVGSSQALRQMASEWRDPYLIPGTDTLRNKLGFVDAGKLREAEYDFTVNRADDLVKNPIRGDFDLAHLQRIHGYLFQDVYDWAGELRTVDIAKGGARFAHAGFLEAVFNGIHRELAAENFLRGLDKEQFVERFSYFYGEINAAHPFREGNGRSTREFMGQLAEQAGYFLDQTKIENNKGQFNEAARMSFIGDLEPIKEFYTESLRHGRAVAFEKLPEAEAVAKFPELRGAFAALREVETRVQGGPEGRPSAEALSDARGDILRRLDAGQVVTPASASSEHQVPSSGRGSGLER